MNNDTTTPPAEYEVYLWAINEQYKYGATTRAEAVELAEHWAWSGGMTLPALQRCRLYARNNPSSILKGTNQ